MNKTKTKNVSQQQLTWEQPRPIRNVRKNPAKDGVSVPNSVTEDIGGFSIAPRYSLKQLRRSNHLQISYRQTTRLTAHRAKILASHLDNWRGYI